MWLYPTFFKALPQPNNTQTISQHKISYACINAYDVYDTCHSFLYLKAFGSSFVYATERRAKKNREISKNKSDTQEKKRKLHESAECNQISQVLSAYCFEYVNRIV